MRAASTLVGILGVGVGLHLRGGYERTADIGVPEEAKVLDARVAQADVFLHKANGRMRCRVRHWDHYRHGLAVCHPWDLVLACQLPPVVAANLL